VEGPKGTDPKNTAKNTGHPEAPGPIRQNIGLQRDLEWSQAGRDRGTLNAHAFQILRDQLQEALALAAVEPDDGAQVAELLRGEIVDLARDFSKDVARVEHQHLVVVVGALGAVEEPQFARHRARVEEIRADRDHHIDIAGVDDLAPHFFLAMAGTGGLRGHHEAGAAEVVQVAPEIRDPQVIAVADALVLVDARQAERQPRIGLDALGVHQI